MQSFIVKGNRVHFEMRDGDVHRPPVSYCMMHDESGKSWPANSVLIGPVRKTQASIDVDNAAKAYFGRDYEARAATVSLPPKSLDAWTRRGDVERIYYHRSGSAYPHYYKHKFKARGGGFLGIFNVGARTPVVLYTYGCFYRLQLPRGAKLNWRGFVKP